jgi:quercetin dioxygenase-like cupin family protein
MMSELLRPRRKRLLSCLIDSYTERVECHSVELSPGRRTRDHLHEGGVIGYVLEGEIEFQIAGQPSEILKSGSAFFEPPNCRIAKFDNVSKDQPARFLALYQLLGRQAIITTLEAMS